MEFENQFTVPVGVDQAFETLTDLARVAPCMPGATLDDVDGDEYHGTVRVKVGPIRVTYQGTATLASSDPDARTAVIEASGRQSKGGAGTASATVRVSMLEAGDETEVTVVTDLDITGKPAQFGRGTMADVGTKIISAFAECLADELRDGGAPEPAAAAAGDGHVTTGPPGAGAEDEAAGAEVPPSAEPITEAPAPPTGATVAEGAPSGVAPAQDAELGAATDTRAEQPAAPTRRPEPARHRRDDDDVIDLLEVAGGSVAKRVAPVAGVVLLALLVWWWRRGD